VPLQTDKDASLLRRYASHVLKMETDSRSRIYQLLLAEYGRIVLRELEKPGDTLSRVMREGITYGEFLNRELQFVKSDIPAILPGRSILERIYERLLSHEVLERIEFDRVTAKNYLISTRKRMQAIAEPEREDELLRESVDVMMRVVNALNSNFTEFNLRENAIRIELLSALKRELGDEGALYKEARNLLDRHSLILISYMHDVFLGRLKESLLQEQQLRQELEKRKHQIESELQMAQKIQQSLLPARFPEGGGLRFYARYLPMSRVGGDFYDVAEIAGAEGSSTAVIMADASGHGVPAAFIAAMTKMIWQGAMQQTGNPAASLQKINQELQERISGNFITAMLGSFGPRSKTGGELRLANGGHHPPVLLRGSEPPRLLNSRGRILGIFPVVNIEDAVFDYRPGDRFVFYTDGLIEPRTPDGDILGEEAVLSHMESTRTLPGEDFCEQLISFVTESSVDCSQEDDVSLLVIDVED
jgi:serine phosphatase RsbU (regulator of sigma subunit)